MAWGLYVRMFSNCVVAAATVTTAAAVGLLLFAILIQFMNNSVIFAIYSFRPKLIRSATFIDAILLLWYHFKIHEYVDDCYEPYSKN